MESTTTKIKNFCLLVASHKYPINAHAIYVVDPRHHPPWPTAIGSSSAGSATTECHAIFIFGCLVVRGRRWTGLGLHLATDTRPPTKNRCGRKGVEASDARSTRLAWRWCVVAVALVGPYVGRAADIETPPQTDEESF